jgi:hypothetical protein
MPRANSALVAAFTANQLWTISLDALRIVLAEKRRPC